MKGLIYKSASWPQLSLKMLRKNRTDDTPKYQCDNCRCARYSPCGCRRKK